MWDRSLAWGSFLFWSCFPQKALPKCGRRRCPPSGAFNPPPTEGVATACWIRIMTSGSDLEGQGSVCCCNILTTPLIISPQEPWGDRNPEAFCGFLRLCRLFFAFVGSSATCLKNDIEKTPKKVEKSVILDPQLPPKTVPKSAAPVSVPRRVKPICFNIQDLNDLST